MIIEVLLFISFHLGIVIGGYTLIGAIYLWSSIWAEEDDTFLKCLKRSWKATKEGKPWYKV